MAGRTAPATARQAVAQRGKIVARAAPKRGADQAEKAVAAAALLGLAPAGPAHADAIDDTVSALTTAIKAAGQYAKEAAGYASEAGKAAKKASELAAPYVQKAAETASPYVSQATKRGTEVVSTATKVASQEVTSAVRNTEVALSKAAGVDVKEVDNVVKTTEGFFVTAGKSALGLVEFLMKQEPLIAAEYLAGGVLLLYLTPAVVKGVAGALRGYSGDLTPAVALDTLENDGTALLVDIRSLKERDTTGCPDIPARAASRMVEVEFAVTEDRKLRGLLRNPEAVETAITAMQVAALKKARKNGPVIVLDQSGSTAVNVAKQLSARGYGKVFVVQGGFKAWGASKLAVKAPNTVEPSVLSGTVFGGSTKKVVTAQNGTAKRSLPQNKQTARALPAGRRA
ncbi:unnamed protein product [Pedinophyceae sp. YPF-701]|nr:unnamed protein product [Pedinophyceae sp. YPF-701]